MVDNAVEFRKAKTEAEIMMGVKLKLPWYQKQDGVPFLKDGKWFAKVIINPIFPAFFTIKKIFSKQLRTVHYELHKQPIESAKK
jgi:hypothetical protein